MSFIQDYLHHEVTITERGQTDVYGKFAGGNVRTLNARVVPKAGFITRQYGKEHAYTYEVYLPADDPIAVEDKVTYQDKVFQVVDVATFCFIDGTQSHRRARIG